MLKEEAEWFAARIFGDGGAGDGNEGAARFFPLLNMGSSSAELLGRRQPWVEKRLFSPARSQGLSVLHVDLKAAPGVDLVGDITDPAFQTALKAREFRSILCTNVLEHIETGARAGLIAALAGMVPAGGRLFLSVPRDYPLHYDPIDTMYRPDCAELAALFPGFTVEHSAQVHSGTYYDDLGRNPLKVAARVARLALPMINPKGHRMVREHLRWLNRRFSVSCLVLRKEP